eukprot:gene9553-6709_t
MASRNANTPGANPPCSAPPGNRPAYPAAHGGHHPHHHQQGNHHNASGSPFGRGGGRSFGLGSQGAHKGGAKVPAFFDRVGEAQHTSSGGSAEPSKYSSHHSSAAQSVNPTPGPEAMADAPVKRAEDLARIPVPEDRIYDLATFLLFREQQQQCCPPGVLKVARALWKTMPEHMDQMQGGENLRDRLFAEDGHSTSRVLHDRKLHHEVRGILGKVTEANLDVMKTALTDLPIRQSTEEEIHEVINVFFRKSTQPEDKRYTPLYVNLVVYLIESIGKESPAGSMIRKEIIEQCKSTFLSASNEIKKMEEDLVGLPEDEAELERYKFNNKQKANVAFLGLMFVNGLVTEMIIITILDDMLYRNRRGHRLNPPSENELVNFMELLQTCGPHFSPAQEEKLRAYRRDIEALIDIIKGMRIKFLLQNLLETMDNNWVPIHGREAKRDTGSTSHVVGAGSPVHHGSPPAGSPMGSPSSGPFRGGPGSPAAPHSSGAWGKAAAPAQRAPDREEFWKVMDDYFSSDSYDEVASTIVRFPADHVVVQLSDVIGRYITTVRYQKERLRLSELFDRLVSDETITANTSRIAILRHVESAITDDLIADLPLYFSSWNCVISARRSTAFPPTLHYEFLTRMVHHHCDPDLIQRFIVLVDLFQGASASAPDPSSGPRNSPAPPSGTLMYSSLAMGSSHNALDETGGGAGGVEDVRQLVRDRLRLLPALLCYSFPPLSGGGLSKEQQDQIQRMGETSVEVVVFRELVDNDTIQDQTHIIPRLLKDSPKNAYPIIAALFTFMRFNVAGLWDKFKATIKKVATAPQVSPVLILEEIYLQWFALEGAPEELLSMVHKLRVTLQSFRDAPEHLKASLKETEFKKFKRADIMDMLDTDPNAPSQHRGAGAHEGRSSHDSKKRR